MEDKKGKQRTSNAPAAALGPNPIPMSLPAAFPASTIQCPPNGAAGASRNKDRKRAWGGVHSRRRWWEERHRGCWCEWRF